MPQSEFTRPKLLIIKNNGIIITGKGIIIVLSTHIKAAFFPGNLNLAKAKAAIECTISAKIVTIVATNNEFLIPVKTSNVVNTCLKASTLTCFGIIR